MVGGRLTRGGGGGGDTIVDQECWPMRGGHFEAIAVSRDLMGAAPT